MQQQRAERMKGKLSLIRYKIAVMSGKGGETIEGMLRPRRPE